MTILSQVAKHNHDCVYVRQKGASDCLLFSLIAVVIVTPHPKMVEFSKIGYLDSIEASFHFLFIQFFSNNKTVLYVPIAQSLIDQQYKTEKSRFLVSLTAVSPLKFKFTWIKIVISSAFRDLYRIYGFIEKNYP